MVVEGCNQVYLLINKVSSESLWDYIVVYKGGPVSLCVAKVYVIEFLFRIRLERSNFPLLFLN